MLGGGGQTPALVFQACGLVRVLAVTQGGGLAGAGGVRAELVGQPGGDRGVVKRSVRKRLQRKLLALVKVEAAALDRLCDLAVARGRGDHCDRRVVLRRGADHGRPTDVDLLDALVESSAGGHSLLERVEVDHDEIERLDAQLLQLVYVAVLAQVREDAGVHARVQRLHAAVEHLREAGHVRNLGDRHTRVSDALRGGAGGDDLHARLAERAGELLQPGLVVDADQSALNFPLRH